MYFRDIGYFSNYLRDMGPFQGLINVFGHFISAYFFVFYSRFSIASNLYYAQKVSYFLCFASYFAHLI